MKAIGQLFLGLFSALASSVIVLAAISLALLEGKLQIIPPLITPTSPAETLIPGIPTIEINTPFANIFTPTPSCKVPQGWVPHTILAGETLVDLAKGIGVDKQDLYNGNCLESDSLQIGSQLFLPPATATPTLTEIPPTEENAPPEEEPTATKEEPQRCVPPAGWVPYVLKPGDYLSRLARAFGTSVEKIKNANCLTSNDVKAGQRLYLPNVPTQVPTATPQPTATQRPPTKTPKPTFTEESTLTVAPLITETVNTTITVAPKETANPNPQPAPSIEPTQ
jgi:LysM repeat protein